MGAAHDSDGSVASPPTVAAFDVDLTLTRRDCVVPFLREVAGWRWYVGLLRRVVPLSVAVVRRDRDAVKGIVTAAALAGRSESNVESVAERFASRVFPDWLRPDTVQRLRWHREQGHRVVLVSASYRPYLEHLARLLGCDDVLATEIEVGSSGSCTGRLRGRNCRGQEKERRLRDWMSSRGLLGARVFAYGDSAGDDEMLAMATVPVRVGRDPISPVPVAA
ncbi:MAG: HAD-IB family hydrolase [Acidimicrobiia bacterium]